MKILKRFTPTIVCVAVSLIFLIIGTSCTLSTASNNSSVGEENSQITLDEAKEITLTDAGLTASEVTFTKTKSDWDNGISVYDIEFYTENNEYEYEVNASTGAICEKSVESFKVNNTDTKQQSSQNRQSSVQSQENVSGQISLDTIKSIALSDAGLLSSDVTYTKEKLDRDDGLDVYDIEFHTSTYKYEYEIDAETGTILSKKTELLNRNIESISGNTENASSYIEAEEAKSIAVTHAGLSVSDVNFSKAKLEKDDGYTVYEVEFYKDSTEYEYKIDALTGTILEYNFEQNNKR